MKLFLIIIITLISFTAYADERTIRESKTVFTSFTYGLHIPTIVTPSLRVGLIGTDSITGIEYGKSEISDYTDGNVTINNGSVSNIGLSIRYFISSYFDSLNIFTSINKRELILDTTVRIDDTVNTPFIGATHTYSELKVIAYTVSIALGNLWIWNNGLFVGVDLYMPTYVMYNEVDKSVSSNGYTTEKSKQEVINDLADLCNNISTIAGYDGVLMLTVGYSF